MIGNYCELVFKPELACVAYERGHYYDAVIRVCNKHSLFETEARFLVRRRDPELWSKVLVPDNPYRQHLIHEVHSIRYNIL